MYIDYDLIGQRIREARRKKGWSLDKLSEEIDVAVAYLSRVETGSAHINLKRLVQISKVLDEPIEKLISGTIPTQENYLDKDLYDIEIQGIKKQWNHCTEGWVLSEEAIDEVGCIHSVQGYDLNYGFIILGDEIGYDADEKCIIVRPERYFDQNGKKTAQYEELKEYIQHIYYVLMTRGILGTYLYICDPSLKEYFSQYMDIE